MSTAGPETAPPLALYVHLPWCVRKCPYCDFNSHALTLSGAAAQEQRQDYLKALIEDLQDQAGALPKALVRPLVSIFIGGGTPSLFAAAELERLLQAVASCLPLSEDLEVTLEANPGTLEHDAFAAYRQAGINRLSLGVQSFSNPALEALGRIHGAEEAVDAAQAAQAAGFVRLNLDLMYGLPGQSLDDALADLDQALAIDPGHLSHYQLTLEPNTAFAANPPTLPAEELIDEMQQACCDRLAASGYQHYEVSAWARPGQQCRHNLNYWGFGDYLAIGAGAHGKLSGPEGVTRYARHRHPTAYREQPTVNQMQRELSPQELEFEYFLNVLRRQQAVEWAHFEARTGLDRSQARARLAALVERGLASAHGDGFSLTPLGHRFLNDVTAVFLPQA